MCVVYGPKCKKSSVQEHNTFKSEFTPMSVYHLCTSLTVLFLGDFNYHANAVANVYTKELFGLFECFGLKNDVEIEADIFKGNTLDLVITRETELLLMDITTDSSVTSDHTAVIFAIPSPKPLSEYKTMKFHRWKSLKLGAFKADLSMWEIHLILQQFSCIGIRYSISQEICTRFLLCCALLWLYIDWFSHIHQAYFTGTVAI